MELIKREGITLRDFASEEARIRHSVAIELLKAAVADKNDSTLGLRAGTSIAGGEFGPLERAARSCATLREALDCVGRLLFLLHGALEAKSRSQNRLRASK